MLRLYHDSILTERASGAGIVRVVRCHGLRSRDHLFPAEPTIDAFLTDLAVHGHVASATQHQAMHALVCLDTCGLHHAIAGRIKAGRADQQSHIPVVLPTDRDATPVRTCTTSTPDLHVLVDWLRQCGIATVALASTGVYGVPIVEFLARRGTKPYLVHARQVKMVPGRRSDGHDAPGGQQWHPLGRCNAPSARLPHGVSYARGCASGPR